MVGYLPPSSSPMDTPPPIPPRPPGYEVPIPISTPQQHQYQPAQFQQQQYHQGQFAYANSIPPGYSYAPTPPLLPPRPAWQQQSAAPPGFSPSLEQQQPLPPPPPRSESQQQGPPHPNLSAAPQSSAPPLPGPEWQQQQNAAPPGFPPPPEQPPPPPSAWNEHLFYSNGRGTPLFESLMTEFFRRLDPQATGWLTPEQVTAFYDVSRFPANDQVWKRNLKSNWLYTAEDCADYELKAVYEGFYIDHRVVIRDPSRKQLPHGGMPQLSPSGFSDLLALEIAGEPDQRLGGLNAALAYYGVFPERGPIPRHVLPPACPPEVRRRLDEATLRCRNAAQEKLDALTVQHRLEAQGRQAAIDLVSDYRVKYRYI